MMLIIMLEVSAAAGIMMQDHRLPDIGGRPPKNWMCLISCQYWLLLLIPLVHRMPLRSDRLLGGLVDSVLRVQVVEV